MSKSFLTALQFESGNKFSFCLYEERQIIFLALYQNHIILQEIDKTSAVKYNHT